MGLRLKVNEIKNSINQVHAGIEGTKDSYNNVFRTIQSFTQNEELQSEAWIKIKSSVQETNQAIYQGMTLVQGTMNQELNTLDNSVGIEDLDEDVIMAQIQLLVQECQMYEEIIRMLENTRDNSFMGDNLITLSLIRQNREMLEKTKIELEWMKEKLVALQEKENVTFSLFCSVFPLLHAIECAIHDAEVTITGVGIPSDSLWRKTISDAVNIVSQTNLENVLGIGEVKYIELYGEENWKELQKYITENQIYGFNPTENEQLLVKVIEQTTGCTVSIITTENGSQRYRLQAGDSTILREYTAGKIKENMQSGNWSTKELVIPETVSGNLNGKKITVYPIENWGAPGKGNYPSGVQLDENGRYKIAVAPKIIVPDYSDEGKIWSEEFENYSKRVDVILEDKITKEEKIIECVVTDYKAHSYNSYPDGQAYDTKDTASLEIESGLIQTGIAYPKSSNANADKACSPEHMSGQVIEFCGQEVDFDTSDYILKSIAIVEE